MQTYREAYEEGSRHLQEAEIENAQLDARLLLEHICHTDRNELLLRGSRLLTAQEETDYREGIARRGTHIPLQYITGVQEFMGLEFLVNEKVLIPRQDTELLAEEVLRRMHDGMRILDMCTGSGCILLSLLHYANHCYGLGADISEEALEVAEANAGKLSLKADWKKSDVFQDIEIRLPQEKFDILISNPPYIQSRVIDTLMPEVREHEPLSALDGREDGLYFYRKIIRECPPYLHSGALLFFEIGYDQGEQVKELMILADFEDVKVVQDYAGLDRIVMGRFLEDKNV